MEVRSDPGKFPFRESFSPGFPTSPARDPPTIQSMRLPYTRDGPSPSPTPLVVAAPFQGGGSASSAAAERPSLAALRGLSINIEEPVKRKRGRPRKHGPDGTMSLALSPTFAAGSTTLGRFSPSTNSASDPTKKAKGRPPGTGKKQQMAALGDPPFFIIQIVSIQLLSRRGLQGLFAV